MTVTDTKTDTAEAGPPPVARKRRGSWIDDWRPEDTSFWETAVARSLGATWSGRSSPSTSASRSG